MRRGRCLRRDVEHLAADHAGEARGAGEARAERGARVGARVRARIGQDLEGDRLQRVACENRGRFVEGAVGRRPAAAQIVVVHRRQIVMNQGIGVQALDRGRGADRAGVASAERPRRLDDQERPQPLAAAKRRVAHSFDQPPRPRRFAWLRFERQERVEFRLDRCGGFGQPRPELSVVHSR